MSAQPVAEWAPSGGDPAALLAAAQELAPGPERIALLVGVDAASCTPEQALTLAELWEGCERWVHAQQQPALAVLAAAPVAGDERSSVWELGAALRIGDGAARNRLFAATALTGRLAATLAALAAGHISYAQAYDIADGTALLSEAQARLVEARVGARAAEQTRAETRRAVAKAVMSVDPDAAERRRRARRRERRVEEPRPVGDGQSGVWVEGPTETLAGFFTILTAWARSMKQAGAVETIGAGRFDALMALVFAMAACPADNDTAGVGGGLTPPAPRPVPVTVNLVVTTHTAGGRDDDPADLPGYGPVTAAVARRLIAGIPDSDTDTDADDGTDPGPDPDGDGGGGGGPPPGDPDDRPGPASPPPGGAPRFRLLPVDPATGWLARPADPRLDHGRDRRCASARQRAFVADRDRVCFMPACSRRAEHNDADHRHPWADGGRTDVDLLGSACGHHNRVTRNNGWVITPGADGTATLTSPLGRSYAIAPHRYLDGDPPRPVPGEVSAALR